MFDYTIKDIVQRTGLTPAFIRKCLNSCKDILSLHTSRGDKNALLIDSSGLEIFDIIGQMKSEGLSIPAIHNRLQTSLQTEQPAQDKQEETPEKAALPTVETHYLVDKILDMQQQMNEEKDKHIQELRRKDEELLQLTREKDNLSWTLKQLPEGKTPEQIRQEYLDERLQRQETKRVIKDLKASAGLFSGKRRKQLIAELEKLLMP